MWILLFLSALAVMYLFRENQVCQKKLNDFQSRLEGHGAHILTIDRFIFESSTLADDRKRFNEQPVLKCHGLFAPSGLSSNHWAGLRDKLMFSDWACKRIDSKRSKFSEMMDSVHDYEFDQARKALRDKIRHLLQKIPRKKLQLDRDHIEWLEVTERPEWYLLWLIPQLENAFENNRPKEIEELKTLLLG